MGVNPMARYGYARVSGMSQDLEAQIQELYERGECDEVYAEKYTGTKKERPEFQCVLSKLKEGDTLVVTKLDRFARSAVDGITIIKDLMNHNINVHILNMGVVENTPTGRLILSILSAFAEFERDIIVERLNEGKEFAKQRGDYREGRKKKYSRKQIEHALQLLETHTYKEVVEMTISKTTLICEKRKKNQWKSPNYWLDRI